MIEPQPIRVLKRILRASPLINWAFWSIVKDRMRTMGKGQAIRDTAVDLAAFVESIGFAKGERYGV